MVEFTGEDLSGSKFEDVSLRDAYFHDVTLAKARFEMVDLTGMTVKGAYLFDLSFSGDVRNFRINGVDVVPLIEAELDRRYPDRPRMRPTDADGFREAWTILERLWGETVERSRTFAPEQLHVNVNGEWSFIQTLRHLVFATDAWVKRAVLGEPSPWSRLDLPHDEMYEEPSIPRDRDARPSLDEVLVLRADRMATVREVMTKLTDDQLMLDTNPITEPGYPESKSYRLGHCLAVILEEEWEHRLYAERDFDALSQQP